MSYVTVIRLVRWKVLALLAMAVATSACVGWRPYEFETNRDSNGPLPYRLRATRGDSSRVVLITPFVRADTLFGRMQADTVGLPITDVAYVERERVSVKRTAAFVIGVPAAALGLTYLIVCGSNDCNPTF